MRTLSSLRRPAIVLPLATVLTSVVLTSMPGGAAASNPTPVRIQIDSISSGVQAPSGTPVGAVPSVLVAAGQPFTVTVSFYDSSGAPASFSRDTRLSITSAQGGVSVLDAVAPGGAVTAELHASMAAVNQVVLTVDDTATGKAAGNVAPDTSTDDQRFDVVKELRLSASSVNQAFEQGIGGDADCAVATTADPVCGVVILPKGAVSTQVLLSVGACDSGYARCGSDKGSVVQVLADLTDLYAAPAPPATMVVTCDKSLCGRGGIPKQFLNYSLQGNAELARVPACAVKNRLNSGDEACVDYVQSRRDGSGDTYLYFLFARDARVSVG